MVDYEGIMAGYPRIRRRFGRLAGYIQLVRPYTLVAPTLAGLLGVLTPLEEIHLENIIVAIYVGVTLALAQACGQCLNQYSDADLDSKARPYRPIPSKLITREEALGLSWLLAIIAAGRGFTISSFFGLMILTLLFFAVFYSLAPLSPRRVNALLNALWLAASRGFLPMIAVWSVYGDVHGALPYALFTFIWVLSFQPSKDVADSRWDRAYGIKTIPNSYGMDGLRKWMIGGTITWVGACLILMKPLMLALTPIAVLASFTTETEAKITENTVSWALMYAGLALIYLLMALSRLL